MAEDRNPGVDLAHRSGLDVVGEHGTAADAWGVWRAFISGSAVPAISIPDTDDERAALDLQEAWLQVARSHDLFGNRQEFLISIDSPGISKRPWLLVHLLHTFDISGLGTVWFQPAFVASDVARTVSIGVSTEEDDYRIFVSEPIR